MHYENATAVSDGDTRLVAFGAAAAGSMQSAAQPVSPAAISPLLSVG